MAYKILISGSADLTKIFITETFLISMVTFIVNIALVMIATIVFNSVFSTGLTLVLMLLRVDIFTIMTLMASAFGIMLIATLIPLSKIIKLKPIDAIKNL